MGRPDECDIILGCSQDCDLEGTPDECQEPAPCQCSDGAIVFIDPVLDGNNEWFDSRQAYPYNDVADLKGRTIFVVAGPDNAEANDGACWSICETSANAGLHSGIGPAAPVIVSVVNDGANNYTITLDRPITHGEVTTLTYDNTGAGGNTVFTATFRYLPGDVNGDGTSTPDDILAAIDSLKNIAPLPPDQVDAERSGEADAVDILAVINLLNGGGDHDEWLNMTIPPRQGCVP
ncbi:MAG: hypothetical protein IID43_05710 [Planctomycetes bacterium]|nr:hypothetical protein [Planctomycetota bacterium]